VNDFERAVTYLNDPLNWTRRGGILDLLGEHVGVSLAAVAMAMVVALPLGVLLGRARRGSGAVVVLSNVSRAIPTLALLTLFAVSPIGFGDEATALALAIFAVPPMLTNTSVGFRGVDADLREAARAMGMSRGQVLRRVEAPLAAPLVLTGIRTATVQVVATATLAALVGGGGLGRLINLGFGQRDYGVMIAGALLVALLAIATELLLVVVSWALTPGPRRLPFRRVPRATAASGTPEPTATGVPS
jgi:ABC-type proline/glycine betaine transport system permease subunit